MRHRYRRGLAAAAWLTVAATPAHAAHLVEVDRTEQRPEVPQAASLDPCSGTFASYLNFGADGRSATLEQRMSLALNGTSSSCSAAVAAVATGSITYMIAPDAGEADGDPVSVCAQARGSALTRSTGGFGGTSALGAISSLANPAFVRVNATDVVTLGPFSETAGRDQGQSKHVVAAAIGDTVQLEMKGAVTGSGDGVGSVHTHESGRLAAYIGACPTAPAPLATPTGLLALLAALGAGGAWTLRRRR